MRIEVVDAAGFAPYAAQVHAFEPLVTYPIEGGADRFWIDHGPRYVGFFAALGDAWFMLLLDGERVVGIGAAAFRDVRGPGGRVVRGMADASKSGPITAEHKRTFAKELRLDEKHMEVTPEIQKIADELGGTETNPVTQARKFYDYVIQKSEHYSKLGPDPLGKCLGDAMECLCGAGDCCTDQHALFIALCRARGIPCRLIYGSRLNYAKEGQDYDPGYRCWPRFFAPGLGWVPVDVSAGDATKDNDADRWFGGLDDRRIEWSEGRDFDLEPKSAVKPDLVIRAWVEVDGKVHKGDMSGKSPKGYDRVINFKRV